MLSILLDREDSTKAFKEVLVIDNREFKDNL